MSLFGQVTTLSDLEPGDQGDCFALLISRDRAQTRDGKPYYRLSFRDARRTVGCMIWSDTILFPDCESKWQPGQFYKLRCEFFENQYGPQINLEKIRPVEANDRQQGFNPNDFYEHTRFNVDEMFAELVAIAEEHITETPLLQLVLGLLREHEELLKRMSAAARHHHAFTGGFIEHVLSVTRTSVYLADKYAAYYPDIHPPLCKSLVVAGAILHDIGKTQELDHQPSGADYTPVGRLIGHILLGRDMVREQARSISDLNPETLLRLEHLIVAHQNLPEWGSPVAPHTPEALIVHFADDLDAKYHMMAEALTPPPAAGEVFTSRDNPLRRAIFRGNVEGS